MHSGSLDSQDREGAVSFFFTRQTAKPPTKAAGKPFVASRPGVHAKQAATTLHRLGCRGCPLDTAKILTPKMAPTLATNTEIYFLAEAPGRDEDENTGQPLTGPSGTLLRSCFPSGSRILDLLSFDNVVNCRPDNNRTPVWNEIECCRPRRIKWIEQAKPKLIVGLGAVPLHWATGSTDLAGMRGRLFAVKIGSHQCWFLPTYHPSFILRIAKNKQKPLNSMLGHCFRMDIKRAFNLVGDLDVPSIDNIADITANVTTYSGNISHKSGDNYERLLSDLSLIKASPLKAVDLETKGLRPFSSGAAIMSISFSTDDRNIAIALEHPQAVWGKDQIHTIKARIKDIISDDTIKVAHNAPFEIEWLIWLLGKEVMHHGAWACTQMQAHFLDERRGKQYGSDDDRRAGYQKLDLLVKQYFGVAYKALFKLNKKDMSKSDLNEVLIYNAVDTKYTLRLYHRQKALLKRHGLYEAYLEALPRQTSVAMMQTLGVDVDQAEVKVTQTYLTAHVENIEQDIANQEVVRKYVKDKVEFNPHSGTDVISIFRDYLDRPEVSIAEAHGTRYSVDKNVLETIDHPLAKLIVRLRNQSKLVSTYVSPFSQGVGAFIYPDNRIHTNFNTTFAETGRTSSDAPNMQNFPQRADAWVRSQIVAPKNHLLVAFDYGQLEGCTAAMCSRDKVLVKALWEDYDIHQEWADRAAKLFPELKERHAKLRSIIKNKLVFPAIFGAQNSSIAGYLDVNINGIDVLMLEFWQTFAGLRAWQDATMKQYYNVGYVESPTGRRHHYPLTRNQAINHPIQSFACDIVCDSMNKLSYDAAKTGQWHLHPILNIHDDLSFAIPDSPSILEEAIKHIYNTMLTPDYACINVPLSVSCSIGKRWFNMQEIGKFRSNKDL